MNTYSTNTPKPDAIEQNAAQFKSDIAKADTVRASALSTLQQLRTAKANHTEREQLRLAAKLGDDHADVVRLKAEVVADRDLGRQLGAEIDRATAARPAGNERAWALYGFVRDQELQGQPNLTVALFDRGGRWVEALGHACTDRRGYFQLCYQKSSESKDGVIAVDVRSPLCLQVSSQKKEVLYRDLKPMSVVLGEVKYREIILGGESATCQPPQAASSGEPPKATKSPVPAAKSQKARSTKAAKRKKI